MFQTGKLRLHRAGESSYMISAWPPRTGEPTSLVRDDPFSILRLLKHPKASIWVAQCSGLVF